ncbi:bifunctional riboflavin kinase/FAD synthetase [Nitratireductor pacificus]|uniref:Riboflavin biosynthesis protein n=1 Tax=Nitratireductor pacificus pht-3B TaxID=391937 RepID=K2MJ40_9HYPH|nr:bifunctional riboflavin kinase/FAD synthetase [Nitratireductor pacificus]EKF20710.1 bifunctional riboflavin kinase/FMN adenylyltransferase [Nitratireductor pacificus pht-3B]
MAPAIQRIADSAVLPAQLRGGVVAIGNFDGVHRGHQSVLEPALEIAARDKVPAIVLTFEPHPRRVFQPDTPLFRITPAPMKARLLGALGFDAVVEHPFTRAFAGLLPEEFVQRILVEGLGISHVVTGFDFHYGKNRGGTPQTLADAGRANAFGVTLVEAFSDEGGAVISSSRIRGLLHEGDVAQAAGLLGYRFTVEAEVSGGKKLGRALGFPTANMALPPETGLRHGIYAVRFRRADGSLYDGVASYGSRPTVDEDGAPLLETFLFDFDGDLYGETCSVSLFGFLRGEEKFDGLEPLVRQMKRDEEEARGLLSRVMPLSALDVGIAFEGRAA